MSRLTEAIKKCVDKRGVDKVFIFTGKVVDNSQATVNGTVQVQQLNSTIVTSVQEQDTTYSYNQQSDGTTNNDLLQNQAGPLVFTCYIQPEVGDYQFVVPVNNSYVTVCHTTFQDAFIISFQDVQYFSNAIQTTSYIMDSDGQTMATDGTQLNVTSTNIGLSVNNGANLSLDTTIDIKSKNGAEIVMDTMLSIKNSSTDLKTILSNMNSAVSQLATIVETLTAPNPALDALIAEITVDINNLLN